MEMLSDVDDPRQPSNGTRHDFRELLVMAISAVLSDCDTIEDVAAWSRAHIAWLQQCLVLKNGVPSEDTFLRVFRLLNPKQFENCFRQWVSNLIPNLSGVIAVDGKIVRGSGKGGETAIHMVSAFATNLGLALGQEKVSKKSNEITAVPELLDALYLKGFLVRSHWGIENQLHWVLDVTMKEDASTVRKDNAPANLSLLKKIVLNLLRMDTTDSVKSSLRLKRKRAAWDDDLRMNFLGLKPL